MYKPSKQTFIMEDIQEKYNHLLQQNEALRQENEELESLLHAHGIEYKPKHAEEKDAVYSPFTFPYVKLSIEERVAIFHSLFKGREDVFAQRWFSKTTGKSGYQPVCINEWRRGVCDKRNTNVQIVLTDILRHSLIKTSIVIWRARTRTVVMLSDCMP